MPEYNIPYPKNYFIANKAQIFVEKELSANTFGPKKPLGNIESANFTPEIEKWEHNSHLFGLNRKDRTITINVGGSITAELNEIVRHVVEYLLGVATRTAAQSVNIPVVERVNFASGIAIVNGGDPIVSVDTVLPLSGENEYTEGATADFTVTLAEGKLTLTGTSTCGQSETVIITYSKAVTATKYTMLDDNDIRGRLHVISSGADIDVPKKYLYIPMCEISLDGELLLLPKEEEQKATMKFDLVEETSGIFGYYYIF